MDDLTYLPRREIALFLVYYPEGAKLRIKPAA